MLRLLFIASVFFGLLATYLPMQYIGYKYWSFCCVELENKYKYYKIAAKTRLAPWVKAIYGIYMHCCANTQAGGMPMQDIQKLAELHMALQINRLLYRQGKITHEMYANAGQVFAQRLLSLEKDLAPALNKTAGHAIMFHR